MTKKKSEVILYVNHAALSHFSYFKASQNTI